jgi:hypothetical protein
MAGRFRPTSFRVAFGNVDDVDAAAPVVPPPPPTAVVETPPPPPLTDFRRIQVSQQQEEDIQFERIVVQETQPCRMCACHVCLYRRRIKEMKLNVIIFILLLILLMLMFHTGNK